MDANQNIDELARQLSAGLTLDQMREKQNALAAGRRYIHDEGDEARAKLRAYAAQVKAPRRENALVVVRSTRPEKIAYEAAKRAVWKILCERGEQLNRVFTFTDEQKPVVANLVRYFINDPACEYDLKKGIYLYGKIGSGKTEIMQALSRFTKENELSKAFEMSNMAQIYAGCRADKNSDPIAPNTCLDRCFDEIGKDIGPVLMYGEPLDINETLIYARYERNRKYGQLSHFVSNFQPIDIMQMLSERVTSRMKDLCTSIEYPGTDLRGT